MSEGELVWHVDSDNFVIGSDFLVNLVRPLLEDENIDFSIPMTEVEDSAISLNNWLAMMEIYNINLRVKKSETRDGYYVISDMDYGLTNCCLIRRKVLQEVGGYDSDVRLLWRMRKKKLSTAAIVPASKFYHYQTTGFSDYLKKWYKRSKKFSSMSYEQLKDYFVEFPLSKELDNNLKSQIKGMSASSLYLSIENFLVSGDTRWLLGIPYFLLLALSAILHPIITYRLWKNFL